MNTLGLDINTVVDLRTPVAQSGAIRSVEIAGDEVFEYVIGVALVIYAMDPDTR